MQCWQLIEPNGIDGLSLVQAEPRSMGPHDVRIDVAATAVNYRDYSTLLDPAGRQIALPFIPNSDCAGIVTEVGNAVTQVSPGDRVASCFFQGWQSGECSTDIMRTALGGPLPGVLASEVLLHEQGCIRLPDYLSLIEASTLPCAALTAWNAIVNIGQLTSGDTLLLLGTGGVSLFALQIAASLGINTIITSSSDDKLEVAKTLGASHTINYRTHPNWHEQVLALTEQHGVDMTLETCGAGTLPQSMESTRVSGTIVLIGILTAGTINPVMLMRKSLKLQGLYVGSRQQFTDMLQHFDQHKISPVIDRVTPFEQAPEAYRYLSSAQHTGKIVIEVKR